MGGGWEENSYSGVWCGNQRPLLASLFQLHWSEGRGEREGRGGGVLYLQGAGVCVCVCVWERERERVSERAREREREGSTFSSGIIHPQCLCLSSLSPPTPPSAFSVTGPKQSSQRLHTRTHSHKHTSWSKYGAGKTEGGVREDEGAKLKVRISNENRPFNLSEASRWAFSSLNCFCWQWLWGVQWRRRSMGPFLFSFFFFFLGGTSSGRKWCFLTV